MFTQGHMNFREKAAQKSLLPREETLTSTTRATESKMLRNTDFLMPWLLSPMREKLKWRGEGNILIMNSTGKPSNPSKPVDNFLALDYSFRNLSCDHSNNAKNYWPKWGEVANMQIVFFLVWGFNGPRISQSRVHFCWHHRNSSMDGFPMTWKRNIALFVRKSSIIWPMSPPPWSHIAKFQIRYM